MAIPAVGFENSQSRHGMVIAVCTLTWLLASVAVLLRLASRRLRFSSIWVEDWLIISALITALGHVIAMSGYAVSRGFGKHMWAAPEDALYGFHLALFIAEICYTGTLAAVKLSILVFYWRAFSVRRFAQASIWILGCIVCIWAIAILLVTLLQCSPVNAIWGRFDPHHPLPESRYRCSVDMKQFFYGNAIPTVVTDAMILILPLPYIWKMQMPTPQKCAVGGIFALGIFVTVVSIVRLTVILRLDLTDSDIPWSAAPMAVLSIVEGNIAVTCACLPYLRPILDRTIIWVKTRVSLPPPRDADSSPALERNVQISDANSGTQVLTAITQLSSITSTNKQHTADTRCTFESM